MATLISHPAEASRTLPATRPRHSTSRFHLATIFAFWLVIFAASLYRPPLLDDADATHAQAARAMLSTGDWVTLHVNGIRYLEKAPLPYWIAAISLRVFAPHTEDLPRRGAFAIHLPLALAVLGLAWLGYVWSRKAFAAHLWGNRAALYTSLFLLTSAGIFLFTRVFIPDALLSLLLCASLYAALRALDPLEQHDALAAYAFWAALALAVLTKGLLALVLVPGALLITHALSRDLRSLRRLRPLSGILLFLAIAAPWHILAGLRNTGGEHGHGFFWFYFVNEHVLRFLGQREPRDYNKIPWALYWLQHLLWLFPWSLFLPAALPLFRRSSRPDDNADRNSFEHRTRRLLLVFASLTLVFFSLSTNQEYYTLPIYLPILLLTAAGIAHLECRVPASRTLLLGHVAVLACGTVAASALGWGLWQSRASHAISLSAGLAHRGLGDYTLATSHLYDLTANALAGLRLPATLAMATLAVGPAIALLLRLRHRDRSATLALAVTAGLFLIAAQLAFVRFAPLLSSADVARYILALEADGLIPPHPQVLLLGDQAGGSSLLFYLGRPMTLVDGRSTSMLFGSTFPDAPGIFLSSADLRSQWGHGARKLLFVPAEHRAEAARFLQAGGIVLTDASGKILLTDRPLDERHP